jgi:hypothetical protein
MDIETFLNNWLQGGRETRLAFARDLSGLLRAERERCAAFIETRLAMKDSLDGRRMKILADGIRELR